MKEIIIFKKHTAAIQELRKSLKSSVLGFPQIYEFSEAVTENMITRRFAIRPMQFLRSAFPGDDLAPEEAALDCLIASGRHRHNFLLKSYICILPSSAALDSHSAIVPRKQPSSYQPIKQTDSSVAGDELEPNPDHVLLSPAQSQSSAATLPETYFLVVSPFAAISSHPSLKIEPNSGATAQRLACSRCSPLAPI
jgi:hypothetical protein